MNQNEKDKGESENRLERIVIENSTKRVYATHIPRYGPT